MMVEYGWRSATRYVAVLSCIEILIGLAIIHNTPEEVGLSRTFLLIIPPVPHTPFMPRPFYCFTGHPDDTHMVGSIAADGARRESMPEGGDGREEEVSFTFAEATVTPQCYVLMWVMFWPTIGWGGMNVHLKR